MPTTYAADEEGVSEGRQGLRCQGQEGRPGNGSDAQPQSIVGEYMTATHTCDATQLEVSAGQAGKAWKRVQQQRVIFEGDEDGLTFIA